MLLVRYTALYKRALTQAEFVFYSLACSIPSYLTAALLAEVVGVENLLADESRAAATVVLIQAAAAAAYGMVAGAAIKRAWRSYMDRHSPWHRFMLESRAQHVVVYTRSAKRYYGWIKLASSDDEPRREIVLGDPVRLNAGGSRTDVGSEILFCEGEIARIVRVRFAEDTSALPDV